MVSAGIVDDGGGHSPAVGGALGIDVAGQGIERIVAAGSDGEVFCGAAGPSELQLNGSCGLAGGQD